MSNAAMVEDEILAGEEPGDDEYWPVKDAHKHPAIRRKFRKFRANTMRWDSSQRAVNGAETAGAIVGQPGARAVWVHIGRYLAWKEASIMGELR